MQGDKIATIVAVAFQSTSDQKTAGSGFGDHIFLGFPEIVEVPVELLPDTVRGECGEQKARE